MGLRFTNLIKSVIFEAISGKIVASLVKKYSSQTDDSEETIKGYIESFDKFKQSLPSNQRDIQKYEYKDLKYLIDEKVARKERKANEDKTLKIYMSTEGLGKGMNINEVRLLLRKFNEIKTALPEKNQDVLKIPGSQLTQIINRGFEEVFTKIVLKKFREERKDVTMEQIVTRIERYVAAFDEVPKYTKPVIEMTFDEFEKVADALPSKSEEQISGDIDVSDVDVVYEDDDVLVYLPDEKQKCINIRKKHAPDRGWCTSWEGSGNYYYNYRLNQNLTLYYVINKNLDISNVDFASVILVEPYGGKMRLADGSNRGRYSGSSIVPWDEITKKIPVIADKKSLFVAKPLSDEERNEMNAIKQANINSDAVKELGSESKAEQWLEIRSPNFNNIRNGETIYANLPEKLKKKYIGLGNELSPEMIQASSAETIKYLIAKKKESLMSKALDKLTTTDIALLNTPPMRQFKEKMKDRFLKTVSFSKSTDVEVKYPSGDESKYIALYGFEDMFSQLPKNIEQFEFNNDGSYGYNQQKPSPLKLDIPSSITNFTELKHLYLDGCVNSLPENIGDIKNLLILGLPKNPGVHLPNSISKLIDNGLHVLLLSDSGYTEETLPQPIKDAAERRQKAFEEMNDSEFLLIL